MGSAIYGRKHAVPVLRIVAVASPSPITAVMENVVLEKAVMGVRSDYTQSCPTDCDGVTSGKPSERFCYVEGNCVGKCP